MPPDDVRDFPLPELCPPGRIGAAEVSFGIAAAAKIAPPETGQREPSLYAGPVMVGFDDDPEPEPQPADPEPPLLDLARAVDEPEPPTTANDRRNWIVDLGAAVGVHLLSLMVFMYWTAAPAEIAAPIPVQLVLEKPAPLPKTETKPPDGRLASADLGDPTAKPAKPAPDQPALTQAALTQAALTRAALTQAAVIAPRPELVSALPKPAPLRASELKLADPVVKPVARDQTAPKKPPIRREIAARPTPPPSAERTWGRIPGPTATQDEYLAYVNALIRRNQEMIPGSLLAGRNGTAVISILVLTDGTIAQIAIKESSGYPDIDQRAERMVAAVKRFPPLPQWFKGASMLLSYHMLFGDRMVLP